MAYPCEKTSFIAFGKEFLMIWVGTGYTEAYYVSMVEFAMNRVFDTILQNLEDPFDEVFKALNIMDKFMLCLVISTHYSRLKL